MTCEVSWAYTYRVQARLVQPLVLALALALSIYIILYEKYFA
jgi:hypothetical protein